MTFTYAPAAATDITRVRFHIGDTDSTAAMFTDEEITFTITETGTWKTAVIGCLNSMIARLSLEGEFTADWLTVHQGVSIASLEKLIIRKRAELDVILYTAEAVYTYRPDSGQTEAPTFDSEDED